MVMNRMSLQRKIGLALVAIYLIVIIIVFALTPTAVYWIASGTQANETMQFNQQIAMRMESYFSELTRFANMVVSDNELNAMLARELREPSPRNEARLRLGMSQLIQKDGISTYQVLGMYLRIDGAGGFETNTVGLNEGLKHQIRDKILSAYVQSDEEYLFTEPFDLPQRDDLSLWGNEFSKGLGYVRPYKHNGLRGTLVIVASYDIITYITDDLRDYCSEYVLLSANGRQIEASSPEARIDAHEVLRNAKYGNSYLEGYHISDEGVYAYRDVHSGDLQILTFLSRAAVIAMNRPQRYVILISFGLFGIVSILSVTVIVNKYVRPLMDVSRQMGAIANGDFNARVPIYSQDEIGQVSEAFNIMAAKLENTMNEMLEKKRIEQKMRYSLLIAQVDPHFIYNTMNTITYLAQRGQNEDVIIVNKAMIGILQDRLRIEVDDVYDTVEQEVHVVRQYLTIQHYRYQGIFKEKIQVDERARDELILKNLLQPLVENALSHGILENKDENGEFLGGCISLTVTSDAERIVAQISDNGRGMSPERLTQIQIGADPYERGKSIGLRNVRDRIKYIYGENAELRITSREGIGTDVILNLPTVARS